MKEISHEGIIDSVGSDGHVRVRITQMAACAGCKVAARCNASEQKEKIVDVYLPGGASSDGSQSAACFHVGERVAVATSQAAAGRALLLGFGAPLALLLAVLALMLMAGSTEGASAMAALAVLPPYYVVLWLFRDRIAGSISFRIISTNK